MKQIIVVTNHKEQFEKKIPAEDFLVSWCAFTVEDLLKVRDRSNLVLLCADHEDHNLLEKMGLYLRDACIEDEKMLYVYGNKEDVDVITSLVPSMFIKRSVYAFEDFTKFTAELVKNEVEAEYGKPCCLIVDDDAGYVEQLRLQLDQFFRVIVCKFDPADIAALIPEADVALISASGKLKLSETMGLFRILFTRKKTSVFQYYFLISPDSVDDVLKIGDEEKKISISKQLEVDKVAKALVKQFGQKTSVADMAL